MVTKLISTKLIKFSTILYNKYWNDWRIKEPVRVKNLQLAVGNLSFRFLFQLQISVAFVSPIVRIFLIIFWKYASYLQPELHSEKYR